MSEPQKAIRGTKDVLPGQSHELRFLEQVALDTAACYGYKELRTPVFEYTELFSRGVGDDTDIVQKEMYTFDDRGGRSITLRPEGTAGAVRACLEHGLLAGALPCKVSYLTTCYRYDKPQAGRYREFEQFGCECFGACDPKADAELLSMLVQYIRGVGISDFTLAINSIGCEECRERYAQALRAFFEKETLHLCKDCQGRLARSPLRLLDCKQGTCQEHVGNAPLILDFLCADCKTHFDILQERLTELGVPYTVNGRIVRGLDYYTRTVFEVLSGVEETRGLALAAGGRYDGLVERLGGSPTPALGFGVGLERIWITARAGGAAFPADPGCELYIASMDPQTERSAAELAQKVREGGWNVLTDIMNRSLKAQMKYANKIGARYVLVLGSEEVRTGKAKLRTMQGSAEREISLEEFPEQFERILLDEAQAAMLHALGVNEEDIP